MKEFLLSTLVFPRHLVREQVDLGDCKFNGHYVGNVGCKLCRSAIACKWLTQHDEFSDLAQKPIEDIAAAVDFAMHFVEVLVTESEHDCAMCTCEACDWLRSARWAVAEFHKNGAAEAAPT